MEHTTKETTMTAAEQKVMDYVAEHGRIEYCDGTGARYATVCNLVAKGLLVFTADYATRAYGSSTWSGCVTARRLRIWKAVAA
jgi:hypothetical protein